MATDDDGSGQDEGATVMSSPSFDEMLVNRGEPPDESRPTPVQDIAYAATQMSPSYDERLSDMGRPLPSEPPIPNLDALQNPAPIGPGHARPDGPFAPVAESPFANLSPSPAAPAAPAGQPAPQSPLAATVALDLAQNPLHAPHLDPFAASNQGAEPPSAHNSPAYTPAPTTPGPLPAQLPVHAPAGTPIVTAPTAPKPQNRLLLFAATFGIVFVVGSLCFGGIALYFVLGN